jgi:hypothetical protein
MALFVLWCFSSGTERINRVSKVSCLASEKVPLPDKRYRQVDCGEVW